MSKIVFIDNIRSAHNVGSIFRTSDGAGVEKIYIGGYSPTPIDRFGRVQPEIKKTSLGAAEIIPWEHVPLGKTKEALQQLKSEGYAIVAVEQTKDSVSLYDFQVPEKVCYIVGNEVEGVQPDILEIADAVLEIPMSGIKESLNVSVTTGIVLFR